jgi:hypothetical protein
LNSTWRTLLPSVTRDGAPAGTATRSSSPLLARERLDERGGAAGERARSVGSGFTSSRSASMREG